VCVCCSVFIGASEGEIMQDPDVQRSALAILINCVCGPLERVGVLHVFEVVKLISSAGITLTVNKC